MANAFVAGGIWPQNDLISKAIDSEKNKRVLKLNLSKIAPEHHKCKNFTYVKCTGQPFC